MLKGFSFGHSKNPSEAIFNGGVNNEEADF
jgi:hypothetical protein